MLPALSVNWTIVSIPCLQKSYLDILQSSRELKDADIDVDDF
jgi:hypothetical protein